jgi:hypothetical protein
LVGNSKRTLSQLENDSWLGWFERVWDTVRLPLTNFLSDIRLCLPGGVTEESGGLEGSTMSDGLIKACGIVGPLCVEIVEDELGDVWEMDEPQTKMTLWTLASIFEPQRTFSTSRGRRADTEVGWGQRLANNI